MRQPRVVIDCEWDTKMNDTERQSLCQQIMFAYGFNKRATVSKHRSILLGSIFHANILLPLQLYYLNTVFFNRRHVA